MCSWRGTARDKGLTGTSKQLWTHGRRRISRFVLGGAVLAALVMFVAACGGTTTSLAPDTTTGATSTSSTTTVTASTSTTQTSATTEPGSNQRTFTPAELAEFNGKDGKPAYVAVDGVVYDVSASRSWVDGEHTRCNLGAMAGKDLSAEIQQAPANMRALLERMPVVGKLVP